MSADLSFNSALLGAAAAWVKKPAAQESTGPSSDPAATSGPPEAGGQARKGGGKQRAGLGHVVEQKKDATKVRRVVLCDSSWWEHIAHSLHVPKCARTLLPSLGPCVLL